MKVITPHYYKQFKCIAGDCTDTCCAGWDVDVDKDSYKYYRKVKGEFGKRLKRVMVLSEDGGCTFTLTDNNRCPFLNDKNLCDLYTELGEDRLCETCAEFPRFINVYGNVKEMGIAPSCITAGEIIFNCKDPVSFDETDDGKPIDSYNDIDAFLFYQLKNARKTAFDLIWDNSLTTDRICILLLDYADEIQKCMDAEKDDRIAGVIKKYKNKEFLRTKLIREEKQTVNQEKWVEKAFYSFDRLFEPFKGMEVINPDWLKYCSQEHEYADSVSVSECLSDYSGFNRYHKQNEYEYRQLLTYYVYRYFLDSVNDYNILLKMKNAVVGYIVLKHLDVIAWKNNGCVFGKAEQVDIAHLYSRQFEHSYTNFEKYSSFFESKRLYCNTNLKRMIIFGGLDDEKV